MVGCVPDNYLDGPVRQQPAETPGRLQLRAVSIFFWLSPSPSEKQAGTTCVKLLLLHFDLDFTFGQCLVRVYMKINFNFIKKQHPPCLWTPLPP